MLTVLAGSSAAAVLLFTRTGRPGLLLLAGTLAFALTLAMPERARRWTLTGLAGLGALAWLGSGSFRLVAGEPAAWRLILESGGVRVSWGGRLYAPPELSVQPIQWFTTSTQPRPWLKLGRREPDLPGWELQASLAPAFWLPALPAAFLWRRRWRRCPPPLMLEERRAPWLRWTAAATLLLFLAGAGTLWLASRRYMMNIACDRAYITLTQGCLLLTYDRGRLVEPARWIRTTRLESAAVPAPVPHLFISAPVVGATAPLWSLALVGTTLTGLSVYRIRRRPAPGHCRHCDYDLTGNLSGRCPECGCAVPRPARPDQTKMSDVQSPPG